MQAQKSWQTWQNRARATSVEMLFLHLRSAIIIIIIMMIIIIIIMKTIIIIIIITIITIILTIILTILIHNIEPVRNRARAKVLMQAQKSHVCGIRRSFVYPHRCALAGGQCWHPQHGAICLKTIYLQRCEGPYAGAEVARLRPRLWQFEIWDSTDK